MFLVCSSMLLVCSSMSFVCSYTLAPNWNKQLDLFMLAIMSPLNYIAV